MKILFVLESYYPNVGGLETLFTSLVNALADRGHEITVITNKPSTNLVDEDTRDNVHIHRYNFYNRYLFTLLAFFPALRYASSNDLIQTTSYNAAIPAYFAGVLNRKKVFITFHEYWGKLWFTLPFFKRILLWGHFLFEKFLVKIPFHKYIAVSQHTYDRLHDAGVSRDRLIRIYNGISYDEWESPLNKDLEKEVTSYQFIYFGRLGISKGLDIFIDAIQLLKNRGLSFNVVLIIPSRPKNLYDHMMDNISEKNIDDAISVFHHLPKKELIDKITKSQAVVIPSYNEGFCYTAVESVALGMPIISSHRGALPEVVSGKYIALKEFSANALADGMQKAIRDEWSETEIKQFNLDETVDRYISLYQSFIESQA